MDTMSPGTAGVPFSQDMTNNSVIRNSHHHTNGKISNLCMRPCSVQLHDILDYNDTEQHCLIYKCRTKNYKTSNTLITETNFTSNLTNTNYFTMSYDDMNCKSACVVYGLECNLCGLVYVGETKGKLYIRICGHRSGIINNVNDIVYQHYNQPDHSILSMRVRIIEKIYHRTNNPNLATPLRRQNEDYWIWELGTATPYGCNDKIDGIGIISSPTCRSVNVMDIFNSAPRRKRSHGQASLYISYISWWFTKWSSTIDAETVGHASHWLETIFSTTFKTTCLVQLMLGKQCYKSEFKWIQTYNNLLGYCRSQTFQTCWY